MRVCERSENIERASVVQWFGALTLKDGISHCCGSSLARDPCEMPSSAPVSKVVFSGYSGFRPPLINDRLDINEILLKEP